MSIKSTFILSVSIIALIFCAFLLSPIVDAQQSITKSVAAGPTPTPDALKANVTLNNLSSVALNSDIIPAAANARTQGSATFPFIQEYFGESSSLFNIFGWSSSDTNHHGRIAVDSTNRTLTIIDKANDGFNYASANASHPAIKVYSVNQNTSQWTMMQHNGTDAVFTTGVGGLQFTSNGSPTYMWMSGGSFIQAPAAGGYNWSSTSSANGTADTFISRPAAASIQFGAADAASPVAQTLGGQGSRGGTDSNVAGPAFTIKGTLGTGNAAGTKTTIQRSIMKASGTTQQTANDAHVVCESKTLSNTSATTTAIATVALPSNSSGGAVVTLSVQCTDGTNFNSDTVIAYDSFVNKAGAITLGTAAVTGTTPANNSGSCTIAPTFTGGSSLVNINVTPVFTTIVPTTVTVYANIQVLGGSGNATCL